MVRRRAVPEGQEVAVNGNLPPLYAGIAPLTPQQHGNLYLANQRSYQVARAMNAVPLSMDEFPQAARHYPIVFTNDPSPTPLALVGLENGVNEFVDDQGAWRAGAYVPAYLRRYPFLLLRESDSSDRQILCADLSSTLFEGSPDSGSALFEGEEAARPLQAALEFCQKFDQAMAKTKLVMDEARNLELFQDSAINIEKSGRQINVEGFAVISEEKLHALADDVLAGLVRRGVMTLFAAHHLSMTNFAGMGPA